MSVDQKVFGQHFFFSDSRSYMLFPSKYSFIHNYSVSSTDGAFSISKFSVTVVHNLKQKMMHVQCFIKFAIFWGRGNCRGHNTVAVHKVWFHRFYCVLA